MSIIFIMIISLSLPIMIFLVIKKRWKPILIIGVVLLAIAFPFIVTRMSNDIRLNNFANNLFNYPLPPKTILIKQEKQTGSLDLGNGDGLDFQANIIVESELSEKELKDYYSNIIFLDVGLENARYDEGRWFYTKEDIFAEVMHMNKTEKVFDDYGYYVKKGQGYFSEKHKNVYTLMPDNIYVVQIAQHNCYAEFDLRGQI